MTKYVSLVLGITVLLLLYFRSPTFHHYINLLSNNHNPNLIYKDINGAATLNGEYPLTINNPEIYTITLGIKNTNNSFESDIQDWVERFPLILKIQIQNSNNETIFSKIIKKVETMHLLKNEVIEYNLTRIPLLKCKKCTLIINLLEGSLLGYENKKGLVYLSMSQSRYK